MPRRQLRKLCPVTGKLAFRDEAAAEWGAERITRIAAEREQFHVQPFSWYPCPHCPYWHLTTHPWKMSKKR